MTTQNISVSIIPNVVSRPEFAQDHESGLRISDLTGDQQYVRYIYLGIVVPTRVQ